MAIDFATVAQLADAGQDNPDLPGLSAFVSAWNALMDFTGEYGANLAIDIGNFGSVVSSYPIGN
jgi:hypothetical protein